VPVITQPALLPNWCRVRQKRLCDLLAAEGYDAALFVESRFVHCFAGHWCSSPAIAALLVEVNGPTTLAVPRAPKGGVAADHLLVYESRRLGTLVEDPLEAALRPLEGRLARLARVAGDDRTSAARRPRAFARLGPALARCHRAKDPDELALLCRAVECAEAAFRAAREALEPGLDEVSLYALMLAAAVREAGEPIDDFGNDFQIGTPGGPPRRRAAQCGEVAILDVSVSFRGYRSDLCRSFVVGGQPSAGQMEAAARITETLRALEVMIAHERCCRRLDQFARARLDGFQNCAFPHHLGHGIGLFPHEAPRLNPYWNDHIETGDVFTLEPGLYAPTLNAGLRIENDYYLAPEGLVRLSTISEAIA
jgi:Xaa-Pro aminopeptidase